MPSSARFGSAPSRRTILLVIGLGEPFAPQGIRHRKARSNPRQGRRQEFSRSTRANPALRPRDRIRELESWLRRRPPSGGIRMKSSCSTLLFEILFEVRFQLGSKFRVQLPALTNRSSSHQGDRLAPGPWGPGFSGIAGPFAGIGVSFPTGLFQPAPPAARKNKAITHPAETWPRGSNRWFPRPSEPPAASRRKQPWRTLAARQAGEVRRGRPGRGHSPVG